MSKYECEPVFQGQPLQYVQLGLGDQEHFCLPKPEVNPAIQLLIDNGTHIQRDNFDNFRRSYDRQISRYTDKGDVFVEYRRPFTPVFLSMSYRREYPTSVCVAAYLPEDDLPLVNFAYDWRSGSLLGLHTGNSRRDELDDKKTVIQATFPTNTTKTPRVSFYADEKHRRIKCSRRQNRSLNSGETQKFLGDQFQIIWDNQSNIVTLYMNYKNGVAYEANFPREVDQNLASLLVRANSFSWANLDFVHQFDIQKTLLQQE
ncbi:hypothetical protein C4579_02055 [Candidatus Microgenomates bacterium]|nr:MAG: hypothetical protein C4579_02055 [Candidatus Microgenomates bacterium]